MGHVMKEMEGDVAELSKHLVKANATLTHKRDNIKAEEQSKKAALASIEEVGLANFVWRGAGVKFKCGGERGLNSSWKNCYSWNAMAFLIQILRLHWPSNIYIYKYIHTHATLHYLLPPFIETYTHSHSTLVDFPLCNQTDQGHNQGKEE
jgi:hypothetical protein